LIAFIDDGEAVDSGKKGVGVYIDTYMMGTFGVGTVYIVRRISSSEGHRRKDIIVRRTVKEEGLRNRNHRCLIPTPH
jgi:hypothetical protein